MLNPTDFTIYNTFYSGYSTDWIANKEIGLNPNHSVIKRVWYQQVAKPTLTLLNAI